MLIEATDLVKSPAAGEAVVGALVALTAYWNHRAHRRARQSADLQSAKKYAEMSERIAQLATLLGADGKNGILGMFAQLRADFEREASNAARERRRTQRARVSWARWRGEIQQRQDTSASEIGRLRDNLEAIARIIPNVPPELVGKYDQRSGIRP